MWPNTPWHVCGCFEIREDNGQLKFIVEGADLLMARLYTTPPYIPYSDIITEADEGLAVYDTPLRRISR